MTCSYDQNCVASSLNGEIVSESESDDPEAYLNVSDPLSASGRPLILKRRKSIQGRWKRGQEKAIAEKKFLKREESKRVSKTLKECPDIGQKIEAFCRITPGRSRCLASHWGTYVLWQHKIKRKR